MNATPVSVRCGGGTGSRAGRANGAIGAARAATSRTRGAGCRRTLGFRGTGDRQAISHPGTAPRSADLLHESPSHIGVGPETRVLLGVGEILHDNASFDLLSLAVDYDFEVVPGRELRLIAEVAGDRTAGWRPSLGDSRPFLSVGPVVDLPLAPLLEPVGVRRPDLPSLAGGILAELRDPGRRPAGPESLEDVRRVNCPG